MKDEGNGHFHDVEPAPAACPKCGATIDAATKIEGDEKRGPKEGDWSICCYCTAVLVYVDDRFVREAEPEEIPKAIAEYAEKFRLAKARRIQVFFLVGRIG